MKILNIFTLSTTAQAFFDGQFKYISDAGYDLWVVSSSEKPEKFVQENNLTYRQFDIRRSISPIADLRTILNLRDFIRRERFDAVIGHTPKGAMVAMFAAKFAGVRTRIYYRHGLIYTTATGLKRVILKTVERLTAWCATNIINVSPSLSKLAIKDHLNSGTKQVIIGSGTCGGIDTMGLFNPSLLVKQKIEDYRTQYDIAKESYVVGFCGRLCHDKGTNELIEGFDLFKKKHPDMKLKLLLVGSYDKRDVLSDNVKNRISSDTDIISTGSLERDVLPYLYSLMDVFVFPSYREGFGMSVIEASAMEIPILVTRSHGCIDSIKEGFTGEYIELSPEGIALGLERMIPESKRMEYGKQGRRWVSENFDQRILWPKIKDFYLTLENNNSIGI